MIIPGQATGCLRPIYMTHPGGSSKRLIEVDQLLGIWRMKDKPPKISLAETAGMICVAGVEGRAPEEIHRWICR